MYFFVSISLYLGMFTLAIWQGRRFGWSVAAMTRAEHDGIAYRYGDEKNRFDRVLATRVALSVPKHLRFEVRRESWFDRLAKRYGIVEELQIGHETIDARFYFEDDGALDDVLVANARARRALAMLFVRMNAHGTRIDGMTARDGWLVAKLHTGLHGTVDRARHDAVAWLAPLVEALRQHPAPTRAVPHRDDRLFVPRLAMFVAFVVGAGGIAWLSSMATQRLLDWTDLVPATLVVGSVAWTGFVAWALVRAGPTPRRHRMLVEWVFLGWPAFVLCSGIALREVNTRCDFEPPTTVSVTDAAIGKQWQRKFGTRYWLGFHSNDPLLKTSSVSIDASTYQALFVAWGGTHAERTSVQLHEGALGAPWIDLTR